MFDFKTEDDLKAAGFVLTVNKFHTGKGDGQVFEKIVNDERVFFGVDTDGVVSPWTPASANVVVDVLPPTPVPVPPVAVAEPEAEPEVAEPETEDEE